MAGIPSTRRVEAGARSTAMSTPDLVRDQIQPLITRLQSERTEVGKLLTELEDEVGLSVSEAKDKVHAANSIFQILYSDPTFRSLIFEDHWYTYPVADKIAIIRTEACRFNYMFSLLLNGDGVHLQDYDAPCELRYTYAGEGLFSSVDRILATVSNSYSQTGTALANLQAANRSGGMPLERMCGMGLPSLEHTGGSAMGNRTFYHYPSLSGAYSSATGRLPGYHTQQLFALTASARGLSAEVLALSSASSSIFKLLRGATQILNDYLPIVRRILSTLRDVNSYVDVSSAIDELQSIKAKMQQARRKIKRVKKKLRGARRKAAAAYPEIVATLQQVDRTITTIWEPCRMLYPVAVDEQATDADAISMRPGDPRVHSVRVDVSDETFGTGRDAEVEGFGAISVPELHPLTWIALGAGAWIAADIWRQR